MPEEKVILVDQNDCEIGLMNKMEAHEKGVLHRAFSIFVFNDDGDLLIHKRANEKYHSAGLWTNTCCSHPRANETIIEAGNRRLVEEMGFNTNLTPQYSFIYKTALENGLIEHEFDHVLFGNYNSQPAPNPEEVSDWKYVSLDFLKTDILNHPKHYTVWFKIIFENLMLKEAISNQ